MNWKKFTTAVVLGIVLPTSIVTCVKVETAKAQFPINIPTLQKLPIALPFTEAETPEETDTDSTVIEDTYNPPSSSSSVWNTLIQTVGDVIKTGIQHQNKQPNQLVSPITPHHNSASSGDIYNHENTSFEAAPQVAYGDNTIVEKLAQWGWTKVACKPETVFIYGLDNDTVCITPNVAVPAGEYQYNPTTNQLTPVSAISNSTHLAPPSILGN